MPAPSSLTACHRSSAPTRRDFAAALGLAPVRRFLPQLIELIWNRTIDPGLVFDLDLPLDQAAEGYQAMDQRRAVKALLRP